MIRLLLCVATAAVFATPASAQGSSEAEFRATTLDLSATGEVRARPDLAEITAGVQTEGATAAEAVLQNRRQMGAALDALRGQGVADRDVQTESLSLQPQYVYQDSQPRRLTGYQASNSVTVRLHDLPRVGQVVDSLVAAGANQINSIGFEINDRTPVEDAARQAAMRALQAKAELYARASGYRIARLVRLSESGGVVVAPMRRQVLEDAVVVTGSRRVPPSQVAAGELTVSETVSGEYELAPR